MRLHCIRPWPTAQFINARLIKGSNHHLRARSHGAPRPEAQIGSEQFETMQPRHHKRLLCLMGLVEPKEQQHHVYYILRVVLGTLWCILYTIVRT